MSKLAFIIVVVFASLWFESDTVRIGSMHTRNIILESKAEYCCTWKYETLHCTRVQEIVLLVYVQAQGSTVTPMTLDITCTLNTPAVQWLQYRLKAE